MIRTEHPKKHRRGSSPHQELKQGIDDWVRGLRSIEDPTEDTFTPHGGVEQQGDHRPELTARESDPSPQSDEGRLEDDRGEGG